MRSAISSASRGRLAVQGLKRRVYFSGGATEDVGTEGFLKFAVGSQGSS
jgi:hypothetical protein